MLEHAIVHHDIKINGQVDSIFELVHSGLVPERYECPLKLLLLRRKGTDADAEPWAEMHYIPEVALVPDPNPSQIEVLDCHHVNILMPMGYEIKLFCHKLKLLVCFQCFIKGVITSCSLVLVMTIAV